MKEDSWNTMWNFVLSCIFEMYERTIVAILFDTWCYFCCLWSLYVQSLEGRRVEELRQKVAAEAGIFLINFDVHVLPALYTNLYIPSTVFPRIVSAETILFWIWPYVLWPLVTVHKSAETIQLLPGAIFFIFWGNFFKHVKNYSIFGIL